MLAKDVLRLLRVTRATLTKYVQNGIIRVDVLPNKRYDYNEDDIYKLLNRGVERKTCIYACVPTIKQQSELENRIALLKQFCFSNGYVVSAVYSDIANGIDFETRENFLKLLDEVLKGHVEKVVIACKSQFTYVGFDLLQHLFQRYHCKIITMDETNDELYEKNVRKVLNEINNLVYSLADIR